MYCEQFTYTRSHFEALTNPSVAEAPEVLFQRKRPLEVIWPSPCSSRNTQSRVPRTMHIITYRTLHTYHHLSHLFTKSCSATVNSNRDCNLLVSNSELVKFPWIYVLLCNHLVANCIAYTFAITGLIRLTSLCLSDL